MRKREFERYQNRLEKLLWDVGEGSQEEVGAVLEDDKAEVAGHPPSVREIIKRQLRESMRNSEHNLF